MPRPFFVSFQVLSLARSVCAAPHTAGGDATEAFFGLHRFDVLEKPQYQRLQIGVIDGEEPTIEGGILRGKVSRVPYAEPSWLADGYYSPYFKEVRTRPAVSASPPEMSRNLTSDAHAPYRVTGSCIRPSATSWITSFIPMLRSASWTASAPARASSTKWRKLAPLLC